MTTPTGQIGLSDVNVELGYSSTAAISMNDAAVRALAGVASGAISMNDLRGKSNRVAIGITLSANTANYVLNTAKASGYVAGKSDVTLTINSGVYVSSASTGSYALQVDTSWAAGDTVKIINNGVIVGRGGNGGNGSLTTPATSGTAGGSGGPALYVQRATTVTNGSGRIAGGGGGGGGSSCGTYNKLATGGGGGAGGIGVSSGGSGGSQSGYSGTNGTGGTLTSAGSPGYAAAGAVPPGSAGYGGAGGGYGSSGGSGAVNGGAGAGGGGAAGLAIQGYSNVSWVSTGTINGGTAG